MAIRNTGKKDAAVEPVKVVETPVAPVAVKAEAAAPKAEKAAPVKAEKAPAAKAAKKAPAKTTRAAAPKAVKAAPVTEDVFVQYGVMEWKTADLTEKAKAAYTAEGNTAAITSVKLYIKPEERKAYYVINDTATGSIDL